MGGLSRIAVIATFYGPRGAAATRPSRAALRAQTRPPDETWVLVEDVPREDRLLGRWAGSTHHRLIPTPRNERGDYAVIPYSHKINVALDRTDCDYIVYLTDDSLPHPDKLRIMADALDANPEWGAVYCGQDRNGTGNPAHDPRSDAYCVLDHTQVMHRLTADRWPTDISLMRLGDANFWRALHASIGVFYPVAGELLLDVVRQTPEGISGR